MFPSVEQVATLREYLSKGLQFAHDTEVELRFSTFVRNDFYQQGKPADPSRKPTAYRFVPIIDQTVFYRALTTFRTYGLQEHRETVTDVLFNDIRQTIDATGNATWLTKTRGRYTDFHDYNVRASWATEIPRAPLDSDTNCPDHVRIKDRTSFTDGCARYDFTVVQSQNLQSGTPKPQRTSYEIEIEFLPPTKFGSRANLEHLDYAVQHMIFCAQQLLLTLQSGSAEILSLSSKHNVLLEYNTLTNVRHFLGAQPETLHRHHINRIRSGYSLAEKYDGERYLFFVSDNGYSYLIDRSMQVKVAPQAVSSAEKGTILDVEVYGADIFAFDIVFHRGRDLRDRADMTLMPRLKILTKAVTALRNEHDASVATTSRHPSRLHVKPHYLVHEFPTIFERWNRDNYEDGIARDGFIFTPIAEPYPSKTKWSTLLKWKPADMNSIDFLLGDVTETADGTTFELLVGDKENRNTPFEQCPLLHLIRDDPLRMILRSGTIVECTYDNNGGMIPWRPRPDKQKPNYRYVAFDVWKSMHEPVHIEDLEQSPFQSLRNFHNRVKEYVINRAVEAVTLKQSLRCLDLACGRGGDLHKWRKALTNSYTGIDISEELLQEARSRAVEVKRKYSSFQTQFFVADLRKDSMPTTVAIESMDVVSCQFAFHYFYESEEAFTNFIGIVTRAIKPGGIFIASLFDGYRVFDICAKGDNEQMVNGVGFRIIPQFDVRMGIANIKNKEFGIPVAVSIKGDDDVILKTSTVEYVVFPDQLLLRMKALGFSLCESKLFLDLPRQCLLKDEADESEEVASHKLTDLESAYSDLHRYYIFRKGTESEPSRLTDWKIVKLNPAHLDDNNAMDFLKDDSEPPVTPQLYIRPPQQQPPSVKVKEDPTWLTFYLDTITGRPTHVGEPTDYANIAGHYNVFISIVHVDTQPSQFDQDNSNVVLQVRSVETYKPLIYLEDIKHVHFVRMEGGTHHIIARECTNTRTKLLWFPSFIDEETTGDACNVSGTTSSAVGDMTTRSRFSFDDKFTIRELQVYAATQDIKIPSTVRKKADMVTFIRKELASLVS